MQQDDANCGRQKSDWPGIPDPPLIRPRLQHHRHRFGTMPIENAEGKPSPGGLRSVSLHALNAPKLRWKPLI
jgi:hypothetical protein